MKNILLVITAVIFILSCKDIPSDKQTNAAQQAEQNQAGSSSGSNGGSSAGGSSGSLAQQGGSGGGSGGAGSNGWGGGSGGWAQNNNPCQAVDERSGTFDESTKKQELFKRLADAALRFEDHVCVGDLHINNNGENPEHRQLYNKFLDEYPFIFHLKPDSFQYSSRADNDAIASSYKLEYFIKPSDIASRHAELEKILGEFYGLLKEGMDDAEISYVLYSELAKRTYYKELYNDNARTALGAFVDKHAVCEGYSRSYKLLTDGLGIETSYVTGYNGVGNTGHAWNRIKLGGTWYNVDATWDDYTQEDKDKITYGMSAYVWGKYFLTSDDNFYNTQNHPRPNEWHKPLTSSGYEYDANGCVFRDGVNKTQPFFRGGRWYYFSLTDYTFYSSKFNGNDKKSLYHKRYASQPKPQIYKTASEVRYGKDKIYFLDMAEDDKFYVYSMSYNGENVVKIELAPPAGSFKSYKIELSQEDPGAVALRGELMLSKMKDAYFHGNEDLNSPQDNQRKEFVQAIKDAEDLLKTPNPDSTKAKELHNKLKDLRQKANKKTTKP